MASGSSSRSPDRALAALDSWLRSAGFEARTLAEGPGFGDRLIAYTRAPVEVRVISDRSEWSLVLGHEGWAPDDRFDLDVWEACLAGAAPPAEPSSLERQAAALRARLDEIAGRIEGSAGDELLECLRAEERARARSWLGIE